MKIIRNKKIRLLSSEQCQCDLPCVRACAHTGVNMEEYSCIGVYMLSVGARILYTLPETVSLVQMCTCLLVCACSVTNFAAVCITTYEIYCVILLITSMHICVCLHATRSESVGPRL